jgi:hypothetical protein
MTFGEMAFVGPTCLLRSRPRAMLRSARAVGLDPIGSLADVCPTVRRIAGLKLVDEIHNAEGHGGLELREGWAVDCAVLRTPSCLT